MTAVQYYYNRKAVSIIRLIRIIRGYIFFVYELYRFLYCSAVFFFLNHEFNELSELFYTACAVLFSLSANYANCNSFAVLKGTAGSSVKIRLIRLIRG